MSRDVVVLAVFLMVCGAGAGCGGGATSANARHPQEPLSASGETDESVASAESRVDVGWRLPVPALAYNAREGRTVFRHYCAPCHGEYGRGDGFNAYNLDPKPRDLADPGFQSARNDEDLAAVVRTGGGVAGLSNAMPPWGRTLNERQIHNLVRFIRYLPEQIDEGDLVAGQ